MTTNQTELTQTSQDMAPQTNGASTSTEARAFAAPPVDVFESHDAYLLLADLPGVTPEGIHLGLERDELTLEAKHGERPLDFRRRFTLGAPVDAEKVSARLEHGVLRVEVPKTAEARPRTIPVMTG